MKSCAVPPLKPGVEKGVPPSALLMHPCVLAGCLGLGMVFICGVAKLHKYCALQPVGLPPSALQSWLLQKSGISVVLGDFSLG